MLCFSISCICTAVTSWRLESLERGAEKFTRVEGSSPHPSPWERWGSAPSLTPVPSRSPAGAHPPYRCSSDTVQLVLLLESVCSVKLHFSSVLTLLKLLVIKHVTTGARATSDPAKGEQKNQTKPQNSEKSETKLVLTGGLDGQGCRALGPAAQPCREAPPRPAALAMQKGQVAHGSHIIVQVLNTPSAMNYK